MNSHILVINLLARTPKCVNGLNKVNTSLYKISSRFYSSSRFLKCNVTSVVPSLNCLNRSFSFNSKSVGICHERTLFNREVILLKSSLSRQNRNFSLRESFDSAVLTHTSIFTAISESAVVEYTQNFIVHLHDSTGLPWWLSIILTTCLIRTVITLPLALYQNYVIARLENLRIEMDEFSNNLTYDLNREVRKKIKTEKEAKRHFNMTARKEWTRLIERDNCHPTKAAILAIVQIPTWVIFSTAFRNLVYKLPHNDTVAALKYLELSVGGVAWFPDLTVPDSFIIPITLGLINLSIIEVQALIHKGQRSRLQRYITNFFRGFSIFMIPVAASVPSCLTLYWLTSSLFGLCQNLSVLSPRVRQLVGIPATPSTHTHPYLHIIDQFKNRFRK